MDKVVAIIKREYITRVRKKSFVIMTLLGPLIFAAMFAVPGLMLSVESTSLEVGIWSNDINDHLSFKSSENITYTSLICSEEESMVWLDTTEAIGILALNTTGNHRYIRKHHNAAIEELLAIKSSQTSPESPLEIVNAPQHHNQAEGQAVIGLGGGMFIYFFIFLYGIQVMKGVIEEKSNRIIEVLITTVSPFQMMLGKILGLSLVGLTQFSMWCVCSLGIKMLLSSATMAEHIPELAHALQHITWISYVPVLIFFFLGGYLLYASLFAIAGAGSDMDTDTQQFILPITVPLLFSVISMFFILNEPHGNWARFVSIFPFTSPVCMMARLPFAHSDPSFYWDLAISIVVLISTFVLMTWVAGRVYRFGILMYGKRASFSELRKWFFERD